MSYYVDKSENAILKDIVIRELNEFSGGRTVTSPELKAFTTKKVAINVGAIIASILIIPFFFHAFVIVLVVGLYKLKTYFSGDKLVFFIMQKAKKMPDKKISTIIQECCVYSYSAAATYQRNSYYEVKPIKKRSKKPIVISLFCILGAAIVFGAVYLFVPFTIYTDTDGGCAVAFARTGLTGHAIVEETHDGKPVIGINSGAYQNNFFLNYIDLPDELEYIEGEAFMNCVFLKEITIPEKVTELRGDTFHGCRSLKTVNLHDNITAIHANCFMECESLARIELPSQITEIRESTFNGCHSLTRIEIPEGVTRIAARAFYYCNSLREVKIPESLISIGSSAFRNCSSLTEIELPSECIIDDRTFKDSPTRVTYY